MKFIFQLFDALRHDRLIYTILATVPCEPMNGTMPNKPNVNLLLNVTYYEGAALGGRRGRIGPDRSVWPMAQSR